MNKLESMAWDRFPGRKYTHAERRQGYRKGAIAIMEEFNKRVCEFPYRYTPDEQNILVNAIESFMNELEKEPAKS